MTIARSVEARLHGFELAAKIQGKKIENGWKETQLIRFAQASAGTTSTDEEEEDFGISEK